MIHFSNGGRLVESLDELPAFGNFETLYLDFETTSLDPKLDALNPWHHCHALGFAITVDDEPGAWYIPLLHQFGTNLPWEPVCDWLCEIMDRAPRWVNHNIKYDAHVAANSMGCLYDKGDMVCTVVQSRIYDSDRQFRGGYGLDAVSKDFLHEDINPYEDVFKPYLEKNKDYGRIPSDLMAEYASQDVITNRRLFKFLSANIPPECRRVCSIEIGVTRMLFEAERIGMRVNPTQLLIKQFEVFNEMIRIDLELERLLGRSCRAHVNEDCFDVLCNQFGLPVLSWTEGDENDDPDKRGNPSFDKEALRQYLAHPMAPKEVVTLMLEYRTLHTLNTYFIAPYIKKNVEGILHPSYNQLIRTGRMSCKDPNAQQLSPGAKELVLAPEGYSIISVDYSQIEFRFIVHYIQDKDAIAAYQADPDTDFHEWVAKMCGVHRKPAKTTNFLMAFGGGEERLVNNLCQIMELVGTVMQTVDEAIARGELDPARRNDAFKMLARQKAKWVYDTYHSTLPGIKRTARAAASVCKMRGYVYNVYGRRRHIPPAKAHIAFNTLNQGSAADLMKAQCVELYLALPPMIKIIGCVHDEVVMIAPTEVANDPRVQRDILHIMEHPDIELRVPIRCSLGVSSENWLKAAKSAKAIKYEGFENFSYLRDV